MNEPFSITHCNHPKDKGRRFCFDCITKRQKKWRRDIRAGRTRADGEPPCRPLLKKRARQKGNYWQFYYRKNREKVQQKNRQWYETIKQNPEKHARYLKHVSELAKRRYAALPESEKERIREKARQRYWENRNVFSKRALRQYYIIKLDHARYARLLALKREQKRRYREKKKIAQLGR